MTLPTDVVARIRRLHYAEHWKVGTIAAQLGVHHEAVTRALGYDNRRSLIAPRVSATNLDNFKSFIRDTLEKYPRLTATRVFGMVQPRGYLGSEVHLRRYIRGVRPVARAEAFFRVETLPGEEGQVDWGLFGKLKVGNAERHLCCFVMVLSYSRGMYARFALDMSMESFLRGHVHAFASLGGVPRALLYDNLKSAVLERQGDAIRFHPRLLELAGTYHFAPKPCAPYRGNEKGKVERTIRYLRDSFFAARRFSSVADLNSQLARWIHDVALTRQWPGAPDGRRVADVFLEEKPRLLPLPAEPMPTDVVRAVTSGKTPYIRFDGNDYSLPPTLLKKPLTLAASEELVRLLDGDAEVARHERSYDKGLRIEDAEHLKVLAGQKKRAAALRGRDALRSTLHNAEAFLVALLQRNNSMSHETARLLRLVDRYGSKEVDLALAEALARGAVSATSVEHLLDTRGRKRKSLPPLDVIIPESVRHIRVTPHALGDYNKLLDEDES